MTTMIGSILKGRYQVEEKLGEGGAAEVFRATDTRLSRTVVVKLLKPSLASNPEIVGRFGREARDAAGLSHPNIVQVYDAEQDGELQFILMEYCDGGDLKRLLADSGGRLPLPRVLSITFALLNALAYAHQHHIIHRDIKPHNIMICGPNGIKLADFGIARALVAETVTQSGKMLGSAAYLSPEQAQGFSVSPASDLYSVGIVLFEMLTGRVPFDADNPVTLAIKHVQDPPPSPRMLRPDVVSDRLEAVVLRSLAKDPRQRFQTAQEFSEALAAATATPAAPAVSPPLPPPLQSRPAPWTAPPLPAAPVSPPTEPGPRTPQWILAGIIVCALAIGLMFGLRSIFTLVTVPDLKGQSQHQARTALEALGLKMIVEETRYQRDVAPGMILEQRPAPGMRGRAGDLVSVVISRGDQEVDVPKVEGLEARPATELIESAGLKVETSQENSLAVPEGTVVRQTPPPGSVARLGTVVALVISKGPPQVAVPDLVGKGEDVARKTLAGLGLQMEVLDSVTSPTVAKGDVVSVRPSPGSMLRRDGMVQVVLSLGPPQFEVPDVVGLTFGQAQIKAHDAAFQLNLEGRASAIPDDIVLTQSPPAGSRVNVPSMSVRVKPALSGPTDSGTVSNPENALVVPDVLGQTEDQARNTLIEKGLTVGEIEHRDSDRPPGVVIEMDPAPGTSVEAGREVRLVVSTGLPAAPSESP